MRNPAHPPIAQSTPEFARRSNDDKRSLEARAREIAKQEGPTSLVASTMAIIDAHRRDGRVIEIVGIVRTDDYASHFHHKIHWQEFPSVTAERNGYLDGYSGLIQRKHYVNPNHINQMGWLAFGTGIVLGLAMGAAFGPWLGS